VDIAVEALGKPLTFSQCTQSVRDGGKAVMIGLAQAGAIGEIDINRLVRRKVGIYKWVPYVYLCIFGQCLSGNFFQ
jgi:threonine dehydrogenase-like Zn-dependent dehydrogenase